jgi:hypothetical protein
MAGAVDFKKVGTKGYKAWRILSASGEWAQTYRDREKMLRAYKSAIIFPEQLISLTQSRIYQVIVTRNGNTISSQINVIHNYRPRGANGECLDTLEKIRDYEYVNHTGGALHRITVGNSVNNNNFYNHCYFSSQKDAIKYQAKRQAHYLSQAG